MSGKVCIQIFVLKKKKKKTCRNCHLSLAESVRRFRRVALCCKTVQKAGYSSVESLQYSVDHQWFIDNIELLCLVTNIIFQLLYSRKFSSAKNFVKSDRQAVHQEFIFVKSRTSLVCSSVVRSSLFCLSLLFTFTKISVPTLVVFWKNLVRNLI